MSAFQISYNVAPNARDEPSNAVSTIPVGSIILNSAAKIPDGYLLCDGTLTSRSAYADLFNVIGTTWGNPEGTATTFTGTGIFATGYIAQIYLSGTGGVIPVWFKTGVVFTMTGGATSYSTYTWTVTGNDGSAALYASAVNSLGVAVSFTGPSSDATAGTIRVSSPAYFNIPNTSGKTVRGVAATTYTLAATSGADSRVIAAANLPPHRHSFPTPGGINIISAGSTQVLGTGWNSTSIYTNVNGTYLDDATFTPVANTALDIRNTWVAIQYIIRAY